MSRIDELPLDIFGEEDSGSAPGASATDPLPYSDGTVALPGAATETTRVVDAAGIVALAVASGFLLRVFGMSFTLPVLNIGLALFGYTRLNPHHRQQYHERAIRAHNRFRSEIDALKDDQLPGHVVSYRIVYDLGIVTVVAIAIRIVIWMAGVDRIIPDRIEWATSLVAGIALYGYVTAKFSRSTLHAWAYHRIRHLSDSRANSDRH
jgi:hypothetical protein